MSAGNGAVNPDLYQKAHSHSSQGGREGMRPVLLEHLFLETYVLSSRVLDSILA